MSIAEQVNHVTATERGWHPACALGVLLIESDHKTRGAVAQVLNQRGYEVRTAGTYRQADSMLNADCRLVLLSDSIPEESSVSTARALKQRLPDTAVILLTDDRTRLSTIEMIGDRIAKHQSKPLDMAQLCATIDQLMGEKADSAVKSEAVPCAFETANTIGTASEPARPARSAPVVRSERPVAARNRQHYLIGDTRGIRNIRTLVTEVADTDMTVLVRGESGVGKGVVARLIHEHSKRHRDNNLVTINCPAIPESLMESELFGHEAGAFTGANNTKPGRIELANGGAAFFDEIAEIPPSMQVKLLEVIEKKEVHHLGGKRPIKVDVRFLAATNANLERMIASGQFRADLFYRINEFSITIPPLRDRIEDIPILAGHFLQIYGQKLGRPARAIDNDIVAAMMHYHWPGNIRELEMAIHRFVLSGRDETILDAINHQSASPVGAKAPKQSLLHRKEIQMILSVLLQSHWNQRLAAKNLGISYSALRRRIEKYGLKNHSNFNVNAGGDEDSLELTISARL